MKMTTKLLLGATLVAGLSVSAFAACASDVDFGSTDGTNGKKITGLMNGSNPQDSVNYEQVFGVTTVDLAEINASSVRSNNETNYNVQVRKVGKLCILSGLPTNVGPDLSAAWHRVYTLPVGYRPVQDIHPSRNNLDSVDGNNPLNHALRIIPNGAIFVYGLKQNQYINAQTTYVCP